MLLLKKDLANRECLPLISLSVLLLGTLSASIAAIFGDIALDKAISLSFPSGPLETHEMFALIMLGIFIVQEQGARRHLPGRAQ